MSNYTKVQSYSDKELLERAKSIIGFAGFPVGYFIIGVRSKEDTFDVFDDKFYIYYNITDDLTGDIKNIGFVDVMTGTTNPGGKVLKGGFLKYTKLGAAILKSDYWHYDMWYATYRSSRGYELRQNKSTLVYRDADMDGKSEELGGPYNGNYGINFHTTTFKWYNAFITWFIGGHSAGCQVTNDRLKFIKYLKMFLNRKKSGKQSKISYCLLKEF